MPKAWLLSGIMRLKTQTTRGCIGRRLGKEGFEALLQAGQSHWDTFTIGVIPQTLAHALLVTTSPFLGMNFQDEPYFAPTSKPKLTLNIRCF